MCLIGYIKLSLACMVNSENTWSVVFCVYISTLGGVDHAYVLNIPPVGMTWNWLAYFLPHVVMHMWCVTRCNKWWAITWCDYTWIDSWFLWGVKMWDDHAHLNNTYPPHQMYTHTIPLVDVVTAIVTTVVTFNACHMLYIRYDHFILNYMKG